MENEELMAGLKEEARIVQAETCDPESKLVWGEGNLNARVAFIGEAPGTQEDKLGRPFVGPAGRLLDEGLKHAGIDRNDVYITNVVKCRPVRLVEGKKSNRTPSMKEINAWLGLLLKELEVISPKIIVCLGGIAASALIHSDFAMKAEHGKWFDGPLGTRAMATFHPAYILRTGAYGDTESLNLFNKDLTEVAAVLATN